MSRHVPFHTRPDDPIYIRKRRLKLRPNWELMGAMLFSIGCWWVIAWVIWR